MAALTPTKPVKFTDVKPGSQIRVIDATNAYEPFEASVLEMRPEHGPQRIPALIVKAEHNPEPIYLTANGQTRVEVLLDSGVLASEGLPANAVRARSIPREVEAIQFRGGSESAMEVIRFAGGRAALSWEQANDMQPEHLVIARLGEMVPVSIGDYVVRTIGSVEPVAPGDFSERYEVIG